VADIGFAERLSVLIIDNTVNVGSNFRVVAVQ
jgi:hypothetical protein